MSTSLGDTDHPTAGDTADHPAGNAADHAAAGDADHTADPTAGDTAGDTAGHAAGHTADPTAGDTTDRPVSVLFLCTGNAARSVMAGAALRDRRPDLVVETAGTLSVDGMPMSWRTRAALADVGLPWPRHASRQASRLHLDRSDLVIGLAPEHVHWVRREHPDLAHRTATLIRLARELGPSTMPLAERLAALAPAAVALQPWEEVVDPGGGEVDDFIACAREIVVLVDRLAELL